MVSRTVALPEEAAESVRGVWMQIHRLRFADEASIRLNDDAWIPLNNKTVVVAEPGRSFGGIGGGFATLTMTLPLPTGTINNGTNTITFRFNRSDGVTSGYRVLAWNLVTSEGKKILPPDAFVNDDPETWAPPLSDQSSISVGRELWGTASLTENSLSGSRRIEARCADCHAQDGRDLKYFNFSNNSIVVRARFHGLSTLQGEQIASYIRSLQVPNPGRPWNPPYQPGPELDDQPISSWAAGAGLQWVLDRDMDTLPFLLDRRSAARSSGANLSKEPVNIRELEKQIGPDIFRPDGNLNPRQIPIALQLPDWSQWLPHVHPKDAWGSSFEKSDLARLYARETDSRTEGKGGARSSLRSFLKAASASSDDVRPVAGIFSQWSQARRIFLKRLVKTNTVWTPELSNKVYSTQLWQLVKTWELMQEFGLESRGRDFFGSSEESRIWCNNIPAQTSPLEARIPSGPAGVGGSALTNEYLAASWYQLQIILNSGNHRHRDRTPVNWVYVIGQFRDLYSQTQQREPMRLLVTVVKALQSTDPNLGPDDIRQGWRPDENVDPRIMISPDWAPIFKPLPSEMRRALTSAFLAAWLDKNSQYPMSRYLPLIKLSHAYHPARGYGQITGGKVWEAAPRFRDAGISADLVERLEQWGASYTDRAARIQY